MKIGIDIDNVISNFDEELLKEYLKHNKELGYDTLINENASYITRGMFNWPEEEIQAFYKNNIERIVCNLKVKFSAKEYIDKLKADGHEIYIITGRDNGEYSNPYDMTKKWLDSNEIYYNKLILTNAYKNDKHGKTEKCLENNIDIMIDDSVNICKDCIEHNITTLLMDTNYNRYENSMIRMSDWKDIYNFISNYKKSNTLSNISKILILDQSIGKIINIFLDVFLAAYFYKISEQNIFYLSIYNIVGWISATIGAFLVANIIKCHDKVKLYRFGSIIKSLYIFMIIILGEKIVNYVYIIGIMYGISTATTGFPYNMIESENISSAERSKYIGFASAITEIITLIVPIILGVYISFKTYQIAAILILLFSILKLILSFNIKNRNVQKSKVKLKEFWNIAKKDSTLIKLYFIEFFKGINRYGVMSLVVSLLIIYQTNNELELGEWTSLFSLFTIIAMYLFGKYYDPTKKKKLLSCSLIILMASFICVLYKINMKTVVFYNIAYYVFMNIILKITEVNLFDYSNKEPFKHNYNTEYFIFRELFLNVGRTLGYIFLLIFVGLTQNIEYINILFIFIILSIAMVIFLTNRVDINK